MKILLCLPMVVFLYIPLLTCAQKNSSIEFNKITPKDFSLEGIKADTSYGAVIIADVGKSSFAGNRKGWFSLVYKHQRRIKIISTKGFDIATVNIPLYNSVKTDDEEKLESLKASTYNIVDGKVVETKLEKDNVYKEVLDKNHSLRKFTMPAVKEGSIIEYSYTVNSDFLFNLQPWSFQGDYPRLWSEYELNLPSFFEYVFLSRGYHPFYLKDRKEKFQTYSVSEQAENLGIAGGVTRNFLVSGVNSINRWVMKDVPAIKEEGFTSTMDNHISRIEFQMSGQRFPNVPFKDVMGSWPTVAEELMKDEEFGADFSNENYWLEETMKSLNLENKDALEKARIIYSYVQKNFGSKGLRGVRLSQKLKETLKSKKGYVSDLNMLLTLMLKTAKLTAYPVLLSTRSNGLPTETYPLINQYNYVISKVIINNRDYFLDASKSNLGFNKLAQFCYNGAGISLSEKPYKDSLYPDNITESKTINVVLINAEKDNKWVGNFNSTLGYFESTDTRQEINEKGKTTYISKLKDSYNSINFNIDSVKMDGQEDNEKNIRLNFLITINRDAADNLIYFNPMLKEGLAENYFKSAERNYPVELPHKIDKTYNFQIQVPEGYVIDELPKSAKVSLSGTDGSFEYLVSKTATEVSLRSKLSINKATFSSDEYEGLKNFFDYVVKKHAEQIVFKKK